ncbi:MAG: hypothetical protein MMC33_008244 [Icmadophila ericetorum]|nr:hypothetical protein [Icmadophila ericetorum]
MARTARRRKITPPYKIPLTVERLLTELGFRAETDERAPFYAHLCRYHKAHWEESLRMQEDLKKKKKNETDFEYFIDGHLVMFLQEYGEKYFGRLRRNHLTDRAPCFVMILGVSEDKQPFHALRRILKDLFRQVGRQKKLEANNLLHDSDVDTTLRRPVFTKAASESSLGGSNSDSHIRYAYKRTSRTSCRFHLPDHGSLKSSNRDTNDQHANSVVEGKEQEEIYDDFLEQKIEAGLAVKEAGFSKTFNLGQSIYRAPVVNMRVKPDLLASPQQVEETSDALQPVKCDPPCDGPGTVEAPHLAPKPQTVKLENGSSYGAVIEVDHSIPFHETESLTAKMESGSSIETAIVIDCDQMDALTFDPSVSLESPTKQCFARSTGIPSVTSTANISPLEAMQFHGLEHLMRVLSEWRHVHPQNQKYPGGLVLVKKRLQEPTTKLLTIDDEIGKLEPVKIDERTMGWTYRRQNGSLLYITRPYRGRPYQAWLGGDQGFSTYFTLSGEEKKAFRINEVTESDTMINATISSAIERRQVRAIVGNVPGDTLGGSDSALYLQSAFLEAGDRCTCCGREGLGCMAPDANVVCVYHTSQNWLLLKPLSAAIRNTLFSREGSRLQIPDEPAISAEAQAPCSQTNSSNDVFYDQCGHARTTDLTRLSASPKLLPTKPPRETTQDSSTSTHLLSLPLPSSMKNIPGTPSFKRKRLHDNEPLLDLANSPCGPRNNVKKIKISPSNNRIKDGARQAVNSSQPHLISTGEDHSIFPRIHHFPPPVSTSDPRTKPQSPPPIPVPFASQVLNDSIIAPPRFYFETPDR